MEARLASGSDIEKAKVYRELAARYGRSTKAWEYRMQNISHVLAQVGEPWLPGLRPAANVGAKIEQRLARLLALPGAAPTSVSGPTRELLEQQARAAEASDKFSPADEIDERRRVLAAILRRRGQPVFRKALLDAYSGRCAMTDCDSIDALEAAHIRPYSGQSSNVVSNGILLRADMHTLFDLHLVSVIPDSLRITLAPVLRRSQYSVLEGRELATPASTNLMPNTESLAWHHSQCKWE
ncbi:HNH endonuclease [Stenotrophomonas maltophilia]|nr:HNH endonuclease [Stenotrophomonas maltophilia]